MTDKQKEIEEDVNTSRINRVEDKQSVTEAHLDKITKHLFNSRKEDSDEPEPIIWQGEPEVEEETVFEHPFKVSLVPVEDPDDDYLTVSEGRLHFWEGDEWNIAEEEITEDDSDDWEVEDDEGVYTAEYIYAQLKYDGSDWVWSLGHGEENPQDTGANKDDQEQRTWILAKLETDGSIDQYINQDIYETMGG